MTVATTGGWESHGYKRGGMWEGMCSGCRSPVDLWEMEKTQRPICDPLCRAAVLEANAGGMTIVCKS